MCAELGHVQVLHDLKVTSAVTNRQRDRNPWEVVSSEALMGDAVTRRQSRTTH